MTKRAPDEQLQALVTALLSDGFEGAGCELHGVFRRSGITTVITTSKTVIGEDTAAWDPVLALNGNNIEVQATGEALHTINWAARIEIVQVQESTASREPGFRGSLNLGRNLCTMV